MAANVIEPGSSLAELASNLDLSQVPDKLHCSTCQKFLVNAYRTTCCESCVCDKCFEQLAHQCPICKHKPFSQELVRPNKAMRGTAKAYLKTIEKTQAEEKAKIQASETPTPTEQVTKQNNLVAETGRNQANDANGCSTEQTQTPEIAYSPMADLKQSIEEHDQGSQQYDFQSDDGEEEDEDEIEIQVEPTQEDDFSMHQMVKDGYEDETSFNSTATKDHPATPENGVEVSNAMDESFGELPNMGMNYNMNMQPMQMMQQMQQMMMNNPMMGAMGMNPNMFGGFQSGGINGMDMNMMSFNPNQNMFGWNGQHNNFNNPYSNGIAGNFGQQSGFSMSQQGNFQQQFQNGDFQNGYSDFRGRGRGRYRGGRGSFRGRGQFNQYSQGNFHGVQNSFERHQQETYPAQSPVQDRRNGQRGTQDDTDIKEDEVEPGTDNFAPGGQDEVQEALGNDYNGPKDPPDFQGPVKATTSIKPAQSESRTADTVSNGPREESTVKPSSPVDKVIPEAYHEDFDSMAPPTAPSGPSGRYNDFGFRSRGRGRYAQGRASFSLREHHPASPIRSTSQASLAVQSPPGKGLGVQGAPTGPKAMRNPSTSKPSPQINGGGFQIKGQAAIQVTGQPKSEDRSRSPSLNGYESHGDRSSKRRYKYEHHKTPRHDNEPDSSHDRSDRDRKRKRSRRDDYEDFDTKEADGSRSRSHSPVRKVYRSSRHDRDREWDRDQERDRERDKSTSRYRSSRRYHDEGGDDSHDVDDYGELVDSKSSKHRASHRSNKGSKYDERDRDGHKSREKDREERHRKRSRHERDREEDHDNSDEEESRHRSRRHKKEHHQTSNKRDRERDRDRDPDMDDDIGLRISGHSSSSRHAAVSTLPTLSSAVRGPSEPEKDPHTLEREARNRERMLKEQQRREKAAAEKQSVGPGKHSRGTVSGGRRVSYKYEDEIERGMDEREQRRR